MRRHASVVIMERMVAQKDPCSGLSWEGVSGDRDPYEEPVPVVSPRSPRERSRSRSRSWTPEFLGEVSPPRGARRPLWAPFWGSFWTSLCRLVLKMRKSRNSQTVHTKTLIFECSGSLPGHIFGA